MRHFSKDETVNGIVHLSDRDENSGRFLDKICRLYIFHRLSFSRSMPITEIVAFLF
jgi:hypothetical protein